MVLVGKRCAVDVGECIDSSVVILPAGLTVGGNVLLRDLRWLKDVVIPDGVREIGERWFANSAVESMAIHSSVTVIGREAFCNCEDLRRVTFAPGSELERIETYSFRNSGIESVMIPKSVVEVQEGAFYGCKNLKEVTFEEGSALRKIEHDAFRGCCSLARIGLPDGLERIETKTFWGCRSLRYVEIPESVVHIGKECFNWCGLEGVAFSASVEEIGEKAFYDNKLREVVFASGSGLRVVGDYAFGANRLDRESVCFPEGA